MIHIRYYIKIRNWRMTIHMVILYLKLWWRVPCRCPNQTEYYHPVEVMYWPGTAYHWDGKGMDPNGPMLICEKMAEECRQYWDGMWAEYYISVC